MTDIIPPGTVVQIYPGTTGEIYGRVVDKPTGRTEDDDPSFAWVVAGGDTHRLAVSFLSPQPDLPTDHEGLRAHMADAGHIERNDVLERLTAQIGSLDAWKVFHQVDAEIRNTEQIAAARDRYAEALTAARDALARACDAHDELDGNLYDVEIAESGPALLARTYLTDATRALDTVHAINPDGVFTKKRG